MSHYLLSSEGSGETAQMHMLVDSKCKKYKNLTYWHTLESHCTRTVQPSRGGCSRCVHKIVYLAVKKGNILVNILLLKTFIANFVTYKTRCVSA